MSDDVRVRKTREINQQGPLWLSEALHLGQKPSAVSSPWKMDTNHSLSRTQQLSLTWTHAHGRPVLWHLHGPEGNVRCSLPTELPSEYKYARALPTCRLQASSSRRQQGITTTQPPFGCSSSWRGTALSSPILKPCLQQPAVPRGRQELLTPPALVAALNAACSGVPREASEALPLVPCPAGGMRSEHTPDPACRPSGKPRCCLWSSGGFEPRISTNCFTGNISKYFSSYCWKHTLQQGRTSKQDQWRFPSTVACCEKIRCWEKPLGLWQQLRNYSVNCKHEVGASTQSRQYQNTSTTWYLPNDSYRGGSIHLGELT